MLIFNQTQTLTTFQSKTETNAFGKPLKKEIYINQWGENAFNGLPVENYLLSDGHDIIERGETKTRQINIDPSKADFFEHIIKSDCEDWYFHFGGQVLDIIGVKLENGQFWYSYSNKHYDE